MDRIIFDNVQHGFPANEKFMQMVDKNRLAILDVCRGIFGIEPTIVKGVNMSEVTFGGQGIRLSVSSGIVWTGDDLLQVKGTTITFGAGMRDNVYIKPVTTAEKGIFLDGVQRDAYLRSEGIIVQQGSPIPNGIKLYGLRRADTPQYVRSKIPINISVQGKYSARGTLRQTVFSDGVVNICGMVELSTYGFANTAISTEGVKVAQLSVRNADAGDGGLLPYPAAVMFGRDLSEAESGGGKKRSISHFVKLTSDGSLYVYIPVDKLMSNPQPNPPIPNIYYVSVDFNFNSEI